MKGRLERRRICSGWTEERTERDALEKERRRDKRRNVRRKNEERKDG